MEITVQDKKLKELQNSASLINERNKCNMLLDIYGTLLTDRQRVTLELYYGEDFSLGEISAQTKITRQGVMNCIHKAEKKLIEFETKLGLLRKYEELISSIDKLEGTIIQAGIGNREKLSKIDQALMEVKNKI
ncbi:MAG: hypothetical protein FWF76_01635 [Oscillospiraceae bacterium]|nr:hypothetical protein [Oscillospiraceae bacterium]